MTTARKRLCVQVDERTQLVVQFNARGAARLAAAGKAKYTTKSKWRKAKRKAKRT